MNVTKYFIRDNTVTPINHRQTDGVYSHHMEAIEAHASAEEEGGKAPHEYAVVYTGGKYETVPVSRAVYEATKGSLVCLWHEEIDNFGPTGWYIILEGTM